MMSEKERNLCLGLLKMFVLEGKPVSDLVTEGQLEIFGALVLQKENRVQIISSTQYGKSLFVALACIVLSCIDKKLVCVVAPKAEKAKIIMRYFIDHIGDNPLFYSELEKDTKLERLRMEENKERIVLKNGGGIFVVSANVTNSIKGFESAMGEGAKIVIEDEAGLIPDQIEATIFRMIAGHKDGFYCKIGNPFYRNHFLKSWNDINYKKIFIDYEQAIKEGRYSQQFIDEARKKPHFDVLFACQFPKADAVDQKGFSVLVSEEELNIGEVQPFGETRLGVDVAEAGGNFNVIVLRYANFARVLTKYQSPNTMELVGRMIQLAKEYNVQDRNVFVDAIGVGKGVVDRCWEQKFMVTSVKSSEKADDEVQFSNKRAENYWLTRQWIKQGGTLDENVDWLQLIDVKYKVKDSSGSLMIMSKDDMRQQGIESPDVADALSLTFARKSILSDIQKRKDEKKILNEFDAFKKRGRNSLGSPFLNRNT